MPPAHNYFLKSPKQSKQNCPPLFHIPLSGHILPFHDWHSLFYPLGMVPETGLGGREAAGRGAPSMVWCTMLSNPI